MLTKSESEDGEIHLLLLFGLQWRIVSARSYGNTDVTAWNDGRGVGRRRSVEVAGK